MHVEIIIHSIQPMAVSFQELNHSVVYCLLGMLDRFREVLLVLLIADFLSVCPFLAPSHCSPCPFVFHFSVTRNAITVFQHLPTTRMPFHLSGSDFRFHQHALSSSD